MAIQDLTPHPHGYSLSEIGRALGWHYSTISKAVRRYEESQFKT